jgi:RimJ/RimL family protein N-acetyltransferase
MGRSFLPVTTDRVVIRALRRDDVTRFTSYRNDPSVARYQDWDLPYTRDHAHALIDEQEHVTGPVPGRWVQLAVDHGDEMIGDIALWLSDDGHLAMIGYTLAADAQGRGLATEAVGSLLDRLIEQPTVHRIAATLDPANIASARLLERLGFRYEGRSVGAALVRGTWEDDDRYAVLAHEYRSWRTRPASVPSDVRLVELTPDNLRAVQAIETHRSQRRFVATVAESLADALVPEVVDGVPLSPWYRAVEADGVLVGFVMLAEPTATCPTPTLWRLLVDRHHQGRGIGRRTVQLVAQHLGPSEPLLATTWVDGPGGPAAFYRKLGFVPTGELIDGEVEATVDPATLRLS